MGKDFAVFILSHGRAEQIMTVDMLKKQHYTGDWYVVIDDEDEQESIYRQKFGSHILQFNKKREAEKTDTGDLDDDRRVGVFARNAIQDMAKEMGYKYHLQLDDDFRELEFRTPKGDKNKLAAYRIKNLDKLFAVLVDFMDNTSVAWISFALSSDYLGGMDNRRWQAGLFPKTMGSFLMRADQIVKFRMRMNDDITTCISSWHQGILNYSIMQIMVQTPVTQEMGGGMTDIYVDNGTYRKSFYSVMCCPSFVTIAKQGRIFFRPHHNISWNNCVPKVLGQKWRKCNNV